MGNNDAMADVNLPTRIEQGRRPAAQYAPAIGLRLGWLLVAVFALAALLGANSLYLATITLLEWCSGLTYQNLFYQYMFLGHLVLGAVFTAPFVAFGTIHLLSARHRRNRRAIRIGYALFAVAIIVLVTGFLLMRIGGFDLRAPATRTAVYWLHVIAPLVAVWLYWLHRLAGPPIRWRIGAAYFGMVAIAVVMAVVMHSHDPRRWRSVGPDSGAAYFEPSLARTATGHFIPATTLMNDDYCRQCHADIHAGWSQSAHRLSSFNNPMYLASVAETRQVAFDRDGSVKASRWCAGCHDPVPFFSGAFDDPTFDMLAHPTAQAGITCTVCHAITNVNSTRGNADYTIEEPPHYPFATSDNEALQWVSNQLVKAKPAFHKKTFLKPDIHRSAEFCSTCHKVGLPRELTRYKDFLRGQNHYDSYLLSGVSGHGARSFYYPAKAKTNCSECHMPLTESSDFGAAYFGDARELSIHDHLFPAANTGLAWLRDKPDVVAAHQRFLEGALRVDLFGVREGGDVDGRLHAPLRPDVPVLVPGRRYLLEVVIRTLTLGHPFTQGTADSNEAWLDVTASADGRVIGRSGAIDPDACNEVDPWAHFVNAFMLDRDGNRIDRRNPQDIFTTLYNHQIPPGAGQTVHYVLDVPADITGPVEVDVALRYRKFDRQYMDYVASGNQRLGRTIRGHEPGTRYVNNLPITTLAIDRIMFPVAGADAHVDNAPRDIPAWQRWNDYAIGMLLKGTGELRQAAEAFAEVERLGRYDGPLNLVRVFNAEGRLDEAVDALDRTAAFRDEEGFPRWTWAWLSGVINRKQGHLEAAAQNFRAALTDRGPDIESRRFDFSIDHEVVSLLGQTLFDLGRTSARQGRREEATARYREAIAEFEKTLAVDPEDVTAHYNLQRLFREVGDEDRAAEHGKLHARYRPDENAQDRAVRLARLRYPAANHAAEVVVKYPLQRPGAPGLPATSDAAAVAGSARPTR